jgi:competence protein CoiA
MSLYAIDGDDLVYSFDAQPRQTYFCYLCHLPVRVRRGPRRIPHFYHLKKSPSCRLYSKGEDHAMAQTALQSILPSGETFLEKPIPSIHRVADVLWEKQYIAFEIQCSLVSECEVRKREEDYARAGYRLVWILDDRLYNKRILRPAESLLRTLTSYFASLRRQKIPLFYDQFEFIDAPRRLYRGPKLKVDLTRPFPSSNPTWKEDRAPMQTLIRSGRIFFYGDLVHKAHRLTQDALVACSMLHLAGIETKLLKECKKHHSRMRKWLRIYILEPIFGLFFRFLEKWD